MMRLPTPPLDEAAFWDKLRKVPVDLVQKALTLYVVLTVRDTPAWVRVLVLAALSYLINPCDAMLDALPGIGLIDDMAVLAFALERLSHFVTPQVQARVRRLTPAAFAGDSRNHND